MESCSIEVPSYMEMQPLFIAATSSIDSNGRSDSTRAGLPAKGVISMKLRLENGEFFSDQNSESTGHASNGLNVWIGSNARKISRIMRAVPIVENAALSIPEEN